MFHAARKHASHVFILGVLVNKRGNYLILSPCRVYFFSSPSFAKQSKAAVATSKDSGVCRETKACFLFPVGQGDKDILLSNDTRPRISGDTRDERHGKSLRLPKRRGL